MNALPEDEPESQQRLPFDATEVDAPETAATEIAAPETIDAEPAAEEASHNLAVTPVLASAPSPEEQSLTVAPHEPQVETEKPLFQQWYEPPVLRTRIPHFGHLAILGAFAGFGLIGAGIFIRVAMLMHLFGVSTVQAAMTDVHYALGSEAFLYLLMFGVSFLFFPMIWRKGFFAGIQWNGATALRLRNKLFATAVICFFLALADSLLVPGPKDAPIDKLLRSPGAAWLLFAFGVAVAPFIEEMVFRGFLLPSLCTLCDWTDETIFGRPNLHLEPKVRDAWSTAAMVAVCVVLFGAPAALIYAVIIRSMVLFVCCLPIAPAVYLGLMAARRPEAAQLVRPLGENGHPQWSMRAMVIASICTSIPFALLHGAQTGYSIGPQVLLVIVSLVLCWTRLNTRSLAASVLVHASYNFLLFTMMMLGTGFFRHLDKM